MADGVGSRFGHGLAESGRETSRYAFPLEAREQVGSVRVCRPYLDLPKTEVPHPAMNCRAIVCRPYRTLFLWEQLSKGTGADTNMKPLPGMLRNHSFEVRFAPFRGKTAGHDTGKAHVLACVHPRQQVSRDRQGGPGPPTTNGSPRRRRSTAFLSP